jgi:hypothetical protein
MKNKILIFEKKKVSWIWSNLIVAWFSVNTTILIFCIGLWLSREMHGRYVLNVFHPYSLWDVRQSEILLNRHVILVWKLSFFHIFFGLQINYMLVNEK